MEVSKIWLNKQWETWCALNAEPALWPGSTRWTPVVLFSLAFSTLEHLTDSKAFSSRMPKKIKFFTNKYHWDLKSTNKHTAAWINPLVNQAKEKFNQITISKNEKWNKTCWAHTRMVTDRWGVFVYEQLWTKTSHCFFQGICNTTSNDMKGINKSRQSIKAKLHIVLFLIFYQPERAVLSPHTASLTPFKTCNNTAKGVYLRHCALICFSCLQDLPITAT